MGYMRHHALVVTSWNDEAIEAAHDRAVVLAAGSYCYVTDLTPMAMNRYRSFLVAPDGSKEGWGDSDRGDEVRAAVIAWLEGTRYEDGSSSLKWCVVQFGDEEGDDRLLLSDALRARLAREDGG